MNYFISIIIKGGIFLFLLILMKPLSATILISPESNFIIAQGDLINLRWKDVVDVDSFQIQIDDSFFFNSPMIDLVQNLNHFNIRIVNSNTYFWRVRSFVNGTPQLWSTTRSLIVIDITSMTNLKMWTKTDTGVILNGSNVSEWLDVSGNGNHITQLDNLRQPTFVDSVHNNLGSIYFDGNDDFLKANSFILDQPTTVFMVFKDNDSSINSYFFDGNTVNSMRFSNSGGNYALYSGSSFSTLLSVSQDFNIITCSFNGGQSFVREDFALSINGNSGPNSANGFTIGGIGVTTNNPINYAEFYCSEILIFNNALSLQSIDTVEAYLKNKYSPPVSLIGNRVLNYGFCNEEISLFRNDFISYNWSTGETSEVISVMDSGLIWLEVVDSFGFMYRDSLFVINERKGINELDTSLNICVHDSVFWNIGLEANLYSFLWQNGSTDSFFIIKDSGLYWCTITDSLGCSFFTDTVSVQIDSFSMENSLGVDTSVCQGSVYGFYPLQSNIDSFVWSTGEETSEIVINSFGDYSIYVENSNKCIFRDSISINIKGKVPLVDFSFDNSCINETVIFTNNSLGITPSSITNWDWIFTSNDSSSLENPNFTFPNIGNYIISLTVATDSGCVAVKDSVISIFDLPYINFNSPIICAKSNNEFIGISTDSIVSWNWFNNNSLVGLNQNIFLTFIDEDIYSIKLIVENENGCIDSLVKQIEVFPPLNPIFSSTNLCLGDSTLFQDETQSFSIVQRNWTFDVLFNSSLENPKHLFTTLGLHPVSLTVQNAIGCENTISENIIVVAQPQASFAYDKACANSSSLFYDESITNDSIILYNWQIDTTIYSIDSVNHVFTEEHNYNVSLQIETENGCKDDTIRTVTVNPLPNPSFTFSPNYGTAPLEVTFENTTEDANFYSWNFGNNIGLSSDENPIYTYPENGIFNISLNAVNEFNCDATIQQQIAIIPSDLDIELKKLDFEIINNNNNTLSIKPNVWLSNVGTRKIMNADLILRLDNGTQLAQKWEGNLEIGSIIEYNFDSYFLVSENDISSYICVEALNVNDNTEINFSNNKTCKVLEGLIQFSKPYPNPANNNVYLDVITKEKGQCQIEIIDVLGKQILAKQNIQLLEGYNKLQIETMKYQSGKYFIKIVYLDEDYLHTFVVK